MRWLVRFVVAVFLLIEIAPESLYAEWMTVEGYLQMKVDLANAKSLPESAKARAAGDSFDLYIKGLGDGFVFANLQLQATGREKFFCAPERLGFNSQNYQQILEDYIPKLGELMKGGKFGSWKSVGDVQVAFALLAALTDTFPCGEPAKPAKQ